MDAFLLNLSLSDYDVTLLDPAKERMGDGNSLEAYEEFGQRFIFRRS